MFWEKLLDICFWLILVAILRMVGFLKQVIICRASKCLCQIETVELQMHIVPIIMYIRKLCFS